MLWGSGGYFQNVGVLDLSSCVYKQKFTDGQTEDGRTDAGDDNTPRPYWPRGKKVFSKIYLTHT